jgi:DNA-binding PadR family transcriptional regulator
MDHIVLGLLLLQDMTLYELNAAFSRGLSLIYSPSYGSLQNAVKKLVKAEFIKFEEKVEKGRNKKIYSVEQSGVTAFYKWMRMEIPLNKLEQVILSKVFFLGLIQSEDEKLKIIGDMIISAQKVEQGLLDMNQQLGQADLTKEERAIFKYQYSTLGYGVAAHKQVIEWLHHLKGEIDDGI